MLEAFKVEQPKVFFVCSRKQFWISREQVPSLFLQEGFSEALSAALPPSLLCKQAAFEICGLDFLPKLFYPPVEKNPNNSQTVTRAD